MLGRGRRRGNYPRGNWRLASRPRIVTDVRAQRAASRPSRAPVNPVGRLLKQWRERRRMSQFGVALEAEISARHLSFLETGRAQPSRDMLVLLSRVLEVPLRCRNGLIPAA